MIKSNQILDLLKNTPEGYLKPDDTFFATSNAGILLSYKKLGAINSADIEDLEENMSRNSNNEIFCNVLNCNSIFDNVASYQSHYNTNHRFICCECKKSLPTDHLLDLHISESHDFYFQTRVERGERLYQCFVEECKELFLNASERKEHCIEKHKFPGNFRFDQVPHKTTAAVSKKTSKSKSNTIMEVDQNCPLPNKKEASHKNFSFGHQREKTFQLKHGSKNKAESGQALENLDDMKEALGQV